jgi:EAL domain-containing protein (putative c-di-GMP-specific phosphodiesterase class I)/ActR/RegA family two-component response regulator
MDESGASLPEDLQQLDAARVLLIDDHPKLLRALGKILTHAGYQVETAPDGLAALEHLRATSFDVIVSDIMMPNMTGIELLRAVRELDLDVPVILMTGAPDLESAAVAVEYGAFRYLQKPIETATLEGVVRRAVLMHGLAKVKRKALDLLGAEGMRLSDRAALEGRFEKALGSLYCAFQPIVSMGQARVIAYEALVRSGESTLPHPGALLDAAERLGRLQEIGRSVRRCVAETVPLMPADALAFVNLHPDDLLDADLLNPSAPLSRCARRVVLEVTERASLDGVHDLMERTAQLRHMGYRIAVDDLGAGYAGLSSLARLEPEYIKLDMSLVRDVHRHPVKRQLVESMTELARSLGVGAVAEGVETAEELEVLLGCGLDSFQGYYFARPDRKIVAPPAARLERPGAAEERQRLTTVRALPSRPRSRDSSPARG